jgi:ribonuclease J
MLNLVKPEYFIPVHGELRHLRAHEALARQIGIPPQNIFVIENGYSVEFDGGEGRIGERVPGGYIYIDGSGVGDVGPAVLRDREVLGRDGFVIAVVHRDPDRGVVIDQPELISKGFIHPEDGEDILSGAAEMVLRLSSDTALSDKALRDSIKDKLGEYLYRETKRRPMIIPVIS